VSNKTLQFKIKAWAETNGVMNIQEATITDETPVKSVGLVAAQYPNRFICPLTKKVMRDPVMTRKGINYERKAILNWLDSSAKDTCPVTFTPLTRQGLVSNAKLQWQIEVWEKKHGLWDGKTRATFSCHPLSANKVSESQMESRNWSIISSLLRSR
jgi:hypothetical protein